MSDKMCFHCGERRGFTSVGDGEVICVQCADAIMRPLERRFKQLCIAVVVLMVEVFTLAMLGLFPPG